MSGSITSKLYYSDIDINLDRHPISNDVVRVTNDYAVIRAVKNLLLTDFYERPFKNNIGSNVRKLLFENFTPDTQDILRQVIEETITNFEPRCNLIDLVITPFEDNNAISISITFGVINREEPVTLDFYLDRIR
jgi:phage baseplate assembly protein W